MNPILAVYLIGAVATGIAAGVMYWFEADREAAVKLVLRSMLAGVLWPIVVPLCLMLFTSDPLGE